MNAVRRGFTALAFAALAASGAGCGSPYSGAPVGDPGRADALAVVVDAPPPFMPNKPDVAVAPDTAHDLAAGDHAPAETTPDADMDAPAPPAEDAGADGAAADLPVEDAAVDRQQADVNPDAPVADAGDAAVDLPAADAGLDGARDSTADGSQGPDEERYRKFLADSTAALSKRDTDCFHSAPIELSLPGPTSGIWVSLRNGFSTVNDAATAACLASLASASCNDLAADKLDASCGAVLTGHVAVGGYCRIDDDCADAAANFCKFDFAMTCGSRCAPRAKLGERCTDVCTPDTFCQLQADGTRCASLLAENQDCEGGQCGAGLFCQGTGSPTGKCKRIAVGLACTGTWQCPGAYACLVPTGASAGTCGPGRALGTECRVLQANGVIDSDCGPGLRCLPDGTGKNRCSLGHALNESCVIVEGAPLAGELCREGFCSLTSPITCRAKGLRNQTCMDDVPCADGLQCQNGTCQPSEIPANEACGAGDPRACVPGSFCKKATPDPDAPGVCAPLRQVNEACGLEECAPPADCVNNVCTRCQ